MQQKYKLTLSEFLLPGEGIWWKRVKGGIEFLDSGSEVSHHACGPELQHFRSSNMSDQVQYLQGCWKSCIEKGIEIPLAAIRRYSEDGELDSLEEFSTPAACSERANTQSESEHLQDDPEDLECENECTVEATVLECEKPKSIVAHTTESSPKLEMTTSLAKSLVDIVSNIHLLKRFDNLRKKVKGMKKESRFVYNREYTSCSESLKMEVMAAYETINKHINGYEKEFFYKNDRLPTLTEYPNEIKALLHKRNLTQKVLAHEWNT